MYRYRALSIFSLILLLAACTPAAPPLSIDTPPTSTPISTPEKDTASITPVTSATDTPLPAIIPSPTISMERSDVDYYVVKDGDELSRIAQHFNLSPESILFSNFEDSPSALESGTTLVIPPIDGFYYTWKEGETLPKVAYRFGVSILSIVDWPGNGLDGQIEEIEPGTTLFIPGGKIPYLKWSAPVPTSTPISP